ncbi:MAG: agmatinase family protein [Prevotellaceae bacterium]|jgi:agmatinase|nr:agmatinase family protein [Prevotellaceae bacterium]
MSPDFNPNAVGQPNGNYFALPYTLDESEIVLLSVPWDATASYGIGAHLAPEAIIDASDQVDLYDADLADAWAIKIGTEPIDKALVRLNKQARHYSSHVIAALQEGVDESTLQKDISSVNAAGITVNDYVYNKAKKYLSENKLVGVVGGEHSVPFGLIKALNERYQAFGILHIDAHADLRKAYEGFTYSHASIMYNVLNELEHVKKIVSVAVRDYCHDEAQFMDVNPRIQTFTDSKLVEAAFSGKSWSAQCDEVIAALPDKVYISFDIDGLSPDNCPRTGTPVPGGLGYNQALFLLKKLILSGKKIVGFDLCEVAVGEAEEWDANVGARLLYKLCCYAYITNFKK